MGDRKLLEQLAADGITTMFGNPGSSEEGLLDEISRYPKIRYILGLQETAPVLIANGYALATRKPTPVQLHCSVGTRNAFGSLYQAFRCTRSKPLARPTNAKDGQGPSEIPGRPEVGRFYFDRCRGPSARSGRWTQPAALTSRTLPDGSLPASSARY
jgi:hypothetical protein